jgi:hypothetical protein
LRSTRFVSTSAVRAFQALKYIRAVDSRIAATEGDKRAIDYVAKKIWSRRMSRYPVGQWQIES